MSLLTNQAKRDTLSFFITFLIYMPFFVWWIHHASALVVADNQTDQTLSLDLSTFQKETIETLPIPDTPPKETEEIENDVSEEQIHEETPPEKTVSEVLPVKKTPTEEKPLPQEEPEADETPTEPLVEEIPVKPEVLLTKKPKPTVVKKAKRKKVVKKRHIRHAVSKKRKVSSRRRNASSRSSSVGKSHFIARLKAKINAHKSYPRIAQKRGMQGNVNVRFRITSSGKLTNLTASGPKIFIRSAKQAVKSAFPLSTRGTSLPLNVTLTLSYRLKH